MTLADTEEDLVVHGRIGYGTRTPWFLGGLLLLIVLLLGFWSWLDRQGDDGDDGLQQMAPAFELQTFDGDAFHLEDHRGKVVVVNFWASWCEPCKDEMPALEHAASVAGDDVVFVGIGSKMDREDEARAFAENYGGGYPLGRDTQGGDRVTGAIQLDYGVIGFPSTFVISPDGAISTVLIAPIEDASDILPYIEAARGQS